MQTVATTSLHTDEIREAREKHVHQVITEEVAKKNYIEYLPLNFNSAELTKIIMEQERPSERKYTDFGIEFKTFLYIIEEAKEEIVSKKVRLISQPNGYSHGCNRTATVIKSLKKQHMQ